MLAKGTQVVFHREGHEETFHAVVASAHAEPHVTLSVLGDNGHWHGVANVHLCEEGKEPESGDYCTPCTPPSTPASVPHHRHKKGEE